MDYSKSIKIIRSITGLNQNDFADFIDLDPSLISRYESGERVPSEDFVKKLIQKLKIPRKLLELISAEAPELKNISEEEARTLGTELVKVLIHAEKSVKK